MKNGLQNLIRSLQISDNIFWSDQRPSYISKLHQQNSSKEAHRFSYYVF